MVVVKVRKSEMNAVVRAAERIAKRTSARIVVDEQRIEIIDDGAAEAKDPPSRDDQEVLRT